MFEKASIGLRAFSIAVLVIPFFMYTPARAFSVTQSILYGVDGGVLPDGVQDTDAVNWSLVKSSDKRPQGIGFIDGGLCTATLLDMGANDDTPAYILTAGHCHINELGGRFEDAKTVLPPIPVSNGAPALRRSKFDINLGNSFFFPSYYSDAPDPRKPSIAIKALRYATRKGADVAIYELDATMGEMRKQGFHGFPVARHAPQPGDHLTLYGMPIDGMSPEHAYLHQARCQVLGTQYWVGKIRKEPADQIYRDKYLLFRGCSSVGGVSGGPLLGDDNEIYGVLSVGQESESALAIVNENSDLTAEQRKSFVDALDLHNAATMPDAAGCFDSKGVFDLTLASCGLQKPCASDETFLLCAKRQCSAGDPRACGDWLSEAVDTDQLAIAEKGCGLGDGPSCAYLGEALSQGEGVSRDVNRALAADRVACSFGISDACSDAVDSAFELAGKRVTPDVCALAEQGCRVGDGDSCWVTAQVSKDPHQAFRLTAKACFNGSQHACLALAQGYETGGPVYGPKAPQFAAHVRSQALAEKPL